MPAFEGLYLPIFGVGVAHIAQAIVSVTTFKLSWVVPKYLFVIILSVLLLAFCLFIRLVSDADFVKFTGQVLVRQTLVLMIVFALLKIDKIEKCIEIFIWVQSIVAVLIIAQFITIGTDITFFWDLKYAWFANTPDTFVARELIINKVRPPGLYSHAIAASYAMVWCMILVSISNVTRYSKIFILIFGLAAVATLTRSVLPVVLLVFLVTFYKNKIFWLILFALAILFTSFVSVQDIQLTERLLHFTDDSARSRLDFWTLGKIAGSQSLIGVIDWNSAINDAYIATKNIFVYTNAPHNGVLTAYYTGGVIYVLLCFLMLSPLYKGVKGLNGFLKSSIYFTGYLLHASFHNNFVGIADWHAIIVLTMVYRKKCLQY